MEQDRNEPEAINCAYDPARVQAYVEGRITLADLEGVSKEMQYELAHTGYRFLEEGQLSKADKVFSGLLALDPYDAYFHAVVGSIAHRRGNLEKAERHYGRALEINPWSAHARANRGELFLATGRVSEALDDLCAAVDADPEEGPAAQRAKLLIDVIVSEVQAGAEPS